MVSCKKAHKRGKYFILGYGETQTACTQRSAKALRLRGSTTPGRVHLLQRSALQPPFIKDMDEIPINCQESIYGLLPVPSWEGRKDKMQK